MSLKCNKRRYHVGWDKEAEGYPSAIFLNDYESRKGIFIIMAKVFYKYSRVYVFSSSVTRIISPDNFVFNFFAYPEPKRLNFPMMLCLTLVGVP